MKHPSTIALPLLVAALIGAGCVAPGAGTRSVEFIDPPLSDYYQGEASGFDYRSAPGSTSRKYRVVNLQLATHNIERYPDINAGVESEIQRDFAQYYMPCREQASASPVRCDMTQRQLDASRSVIVSFNAFYAKNTAKLIANSENPRMTYSIANPIDQTFLRGYGSKRWIREINDELVRRYPNLFSNDETAFPVDLLMEMMYDGSGRRRTRSLYEAWLVGLPEHADITIGDCVNPGRLFKAKQAYTNPYDAIAAAIFKEDASRLDWMEPANPSDYEWIYDGSIPVKHFNEALGEWKAAKIEHIVNLIESPK